MISELWAEKHRPHELSDLALNEENRKLFESMLESGEPLHLLLDGPAGCGKTTVAKLLGAKLDCSVLQLNASSERGIDVIREKVASFARTMFTTRWNIVFLDEADKMTADAQTALRNLMETHSARTRFILTCNYRDKIIDPIQSRCTLVKMGEVPFRERVRILKQILQAEDIKLTEDDIPTLVEYAERYTDLRRMVTAAQKSVLSTGKLSSIGDTPHGGAEVWNKILGSDYKGLVSLSRGAGFDHQAALRSLFWAIPEDHQRAATLRVLVKRSVHESGFTPDVVVHFCGTCAELMLAARGELEA